MLPYMHPHGCVYVSTAYININRVNLLLLIILTAQEEVASLGCNLNQRVTFGGSMPMSNRSTRFAWYPDCSCGDGEGGRQIYNLKD